MSDQRVEEVLLANIRLANELEQEQQRRPAIDRMVANRLAEVIAENNQLRQAAESLQKTLRAILSGELKLEDAEVPDLKTSVNEVFYGRCVHAGPWKRVPKTDSIERCEGCGAEHGK